MTADGPPALPQAEPLGDAPLPSRLEPLVETARAYARAATSKNTNRAYAADWRDYLRWRARQGLDSRPLADPECVGLYLAAQGQEHAVVEEFRPARALKRILRAHDQAGDFRAAQAAGEAEEQDRPVAQIA